MSLEWARSRVLEKAALERQRAKSIQGADAPEVEMVFPLGVTFWGERAPFAEVIAPRIPDRETERMPRDPDPNHLLSSKGA